MGSCVALRALALLWVAAAYPVLFRARPVEALAANWGTRALHPLPGDITVRLLRDNGFDKVKLFEADPPALQALGHSGIQVMIGLPNELLTPVAGSVKAAEQWVLQNVSNYISKYGVDIRYVAVGNEPFLKSYKGKFEAATLPAVKNVQAALVKAGLGKQVRVTVPLNADVYDSPDGRPSSGDFRPDISGLMVRLVRFLLDNNGVLSINIYPFLSLQADPNFPVDYAFFPAPGAPPSQASVQDGNVLYSNVFDANYDTLIAALEKHGLGAIPVVVGEIGWPTDGDKNANAANAQRFNKGLFDRILAGKGTPRRPQMPDVYIFALLDEDAKSVDPGNFERHWGVFNYDGSPKYQLRLGNGRPIVPAKGVRYLSKQWCVLRPDASPAGPAIGSAVGYACQYADCTSLGPGSSCSGLDVRGNVSYAFNQFFQAANQQKASCNFNNLSIITTTDPSKGTCRFEIMIDNGKHELTGKPNAGSRATAAWSTVLTLGFVGLIMTAW
ncbi:glucan endo-1,3-beta-glucosidase 5-like [Phragmites australis]|uniref:glucan endo-1,3-beta-glucosidase 5-like n=1 Tax=Phragmites australis TaxID=29695 RepID=UPI002D7A3DA3|nr:glucan endo-1,3-beta-glucosidase 5-like [Phragmites australis]